MFRLHLNICGGDGNMTKKKILTKDPISIKFLLKMNREKGCGNLRCKIEVLLTTTKTKNPYQPFLRYFKDTEY